MADKHKDQDDTQDSETTSSAGASAPRQTRAIVRGAMMHQGGGGFRVYTAGEEDDLERVMTPEQAERLKADGSIAGDWKPKGKGVPVMRGSAKHREESANARYAPGAATKPHPAEAENAELRERLKKLESDLAAKQKAEESAAHVARQSPPPAAEGDGGHKHGKGK